MTIPRRGGVIHWVLQKKGWGSWWVGYGWIGLGWVGLKFYLPSRVSFLTLAYVAWKTRLWSSRFSCDLLFSFVALLSTDSTSSEDFEEPDTLDSGVRLWWWFETQISRPKFRYNNILFIGFQWILMFLIWYLSEPACKFSPRFYLFFIILPD